MIINCNSTSIDLLQGHVMGVLNVTPDSFYDGGKYTAQTKILSQVKQMLEEGATFIDIGGASSKPGSNPVPSKVEIERVIPAISVILQKLSQNGHFNRYHFQSGCREGYRTWSCNCQRYFSRQD